MSIEPEICGWCGGPDPDMNGHIVPKCLWSKGERPCTLGSIPAHKPCDQAFSQDEVYFRDLLMQVADAYGRSEKFDSVLEGEYRRSCETGRTNLQQLADSVSWKPYLSEGGIYLGYRASRPFDSERVNRVIGKIARGLFFFKEKRPLPLTHTAGIWASNDFWKWFPHPLPFKNFGDDVFHAYSYQYPDDPNHTLHVMVFYRTVSYLAMTVPCERVGMTVAENRHDSTITIGAKRVAPV